eukprot:gene27941-34542_t
MKAEDIAMQEEEGLTAVTTGREIVTVTKEEKVMTMPEEKENIVLTEEEFTAVKEEEENIAVIKEAESIAVTEKEEVIAVTEVEEAIAATEVEEAIAATEVEEAIAMIPEEEVIAVTKVEEVIAVTEVEEAIAATEVEEAIAVTDVEEAIAATEVEEAIAVSEVEEAIAMTEVEEVIAVTAEEEVIAVTEVEEAIAMTAEEEVIAMTAEEDLVVTEAASVESSTAVTGGSTEARSGQAQTAAASEDALDTLAELNSSLELGVAPTPGSPAGRTVLTKTCQGRRMRVQRLLTSNISSATACQQQDSESLVEHAARCEQATTRSPAPADMIDLSMESPPSSGRLADGAVLPQVAWLPDSLFTNALVDGPGGGASFDYAPAGSRELAEGSGWAQQGHPGDRLEAYMAPMVSDDHDHGQPSVAVGLPYASASEVYPQQPLRLVLVLDLDHTLLQ